MNSGKTLEELENNRWGAPKFGSELAAECHRLRAVPLSDLTNEDLRLLIGQKVGLQFLIPLTLDILECDPLAAGHLFRGDLLESVASVPIEFWASNPSLNNRLVEIAADLNIIRETIEKDLVPKLINLEYR
jgi:hypothetical protein